MEFHKECSECYCIMTLLSKKNSPQYYSQKLTSTIAYAMAYKFTCLLDQRLQNIYELDNGEPEGVNEGYAWGKIIMEKQAIYYSKEYDMNIAIARPSNVYGAGDLYDGEKSHVIPALIKRIVGGEDPVVIWGSGNQSRAFIHRDDVAKAFMLLTEKHAVGEPVNVGHENGTTIRDLAVKICQISNLNPVLQFDTSKPEGAPKKSLSTDKLRLVTGFSPKTSIDDGLREMIELFCGSIK